MGQGQPQYQGKADPAQVLDRQPVPDALLAPHHGAHGGGGDDGGGPGGTALEPARRRARRRRARARQRRSQRGHGRVDVLHLLRHALQTGWSAVRPRVLPRLSAPVGGCPEGGCDARGPAHGTRAVSRRPNPAHQRLEAPLGGSGQRSQRGGRPGGRGGEEQRGWRGASPGAQVPRQEGSMPSVSNGGCLRQFCSSATRPGLPQARRSRGIQGSKG
mmetsp:Transcript_2554/g.10960  ORF Transcript_2554/g.10960 Transcript_2554/m.10960 type:complete len:216 (-) Transcript_2554:201-848(-)